MQNNITNRRKTLHRVTSLISIDQSTNAGLLTQIQSVSTWPSCAARALRSTKPCSAGSRGLGCCSPCLTESQLWAARLAGQPAAALAFVFVTQSQDTAHSCDTLMLLGFDAAVQTQSCPPAAQEEVTQRCITDACPER